MSRRLILATGFKYAVAANMVGSQSRRPSTVLGSLALGENNRSRSEFFIASIISLPQAIFTRKAVDRAAGAAGSAACPGSPPARQIQKLKTAAPSRAARTREASAAMGAAGQLFRPACLGTAAVRQRRAI